MQYVNRLLFLTFATFFMSVSVVSGGAVSPVSHDWTYNAYGVIYPGALDVVGQIAYFGTNYDFGFGYTNFLYAVNITNGNLIWRYNTTLPVNYVSNFTYANSTYIIAGTGGSTSLPSQSHVLALYQQKNVTLWDSANLYSSVQSLGAAESDFPNNEDVIAGLANGQLVRLWGSNGTKQWERTCAGNITIGRVPNIVKLDNGSVAVGTFSLDTEQSHIYCFSKDGTPTWNYTTNSYNPLRLIKRFGNLNDVVAAFADVIDVRNGTTGAEIWLGPFNVTQHIPPYKATQAVTDLLCAEDYAGDRFPDVVACTTRGFIMIINGKNATLFRGPVQISHTSSYIQYMYSYENGVPLLNKTLTISIEDSSNSNYVYGVNASNLAVENGLHVPYSAWNLVSISNSSSFAGDLLFSAANSVYYISGADVIFSEFPSQIIIVVLLGAVGVSETILRRHRQETNQRARLKSNQ